MEITRNVYLKPKNEVLKYFSPDILTVDINTSLFHKELQLLTKENKPLKPDDQKRVFKRLVSETERIIIEINESIHPDGPITVNFNFSKMIYPFHTWKDIIDTAIISEAINFPYPYFVSQQTNVDRQHFLDTNKTLFEWSKAFNECGNLNNNPIIDNDHIEEEITAKTLLLTLFQEVGITEEEEMEELLSRFNNVLDLVEYLCNWK